MSAPGRPLHRPPLLDRAGGAVYGPAARPLRPPPAHLRLPPKGWLDVPPLGTLLPGRLVAMRTPLHPTQYLTSPAERFTPRDAKARIDALSPHPLGLVISLANTTRYYDVGEFASLGVPVVAVPVVGKIVPSRAVCELFCDTIRKFRLSNATHTIAIHCTHGVNRTGYLVCRYLIDEMRFSPSEAITVFEQHRARIERNNYRDALTMKTDDDYDDAKEEEGDDGKPQRRKRQRVQYTASYYPRSAQLVPFYPEVARMQPPICAVRSAPDPWSLIARDLDTCE